jgi:type I restriction enzyme, S subunit
MTKSYIANNNNYKQTPKGWQATDIGLIPEDWDVDIIDNHFDIKQGKQLSKKTREGDNQKKFLRTANVFWGKLDLSKLDHMNFTESEEERLKLLYNDLLVCEGGDIGRTAIWRNELEDCYYQNHIHRLRVKNNSVDPHFFMNWMYYGVAISNKYFGMGNRTTIPNLSASRLKAFQFPLPPLPEQKKIAYLLSKIQQAIEKQEQIIKTTQELKKAFMQKLFTEGLPASGGTEPEPQKQTEIGPIPESWEVVKLGSYAKILNGYAFKSKDYIKKGIPLIRISNVSFGFLISKDDKYLPKLYLDEYPEFTLQEGDLILSLTRPVTSGGMKYCFIEKRHLPALLNQRVGRFKIIDDGLSKDFLYHIVFSKFFIGELQKLFGSSSQQPNVSPSQLESFKIPLPPRSEQDEITNSLDAINYKIQYSEQSISSLKSLFISTLNKLMTGQIRVKDIEFKLEKLSEKVPLEKNQKKSPLERGFRGV